MRVGLVVQTVEVMFFQLEQLERAGSIEQIRQVGGGLLGAHHCVEAVLT